MRLIDADALIEKLKYHMGKIGERTNIISSTTCDAIDTTIYVIKTQPTIDAVEVVRCRDCKYRWEEDCAMYFRCDCGIQQNWENKNDYCSWGVRKEATEKK